MQTILERTGDSNWYIKHTDLNETRNGPRRGLSR